MEYIILQITYNILIRTDVVTQMQTMTDYTDCVTSVTHKNTTNTSDGTVGYQIRMCLYPSNTYTRNINYCEAYSHVLVGTKEFLAMCYKQWMEHCNNAKKYLQLHYK